MVRGLALFLLLAAACSAREIEEEGQSRRHLAAQWCEDFCTFWYDCEPLFADLPVEDCQASCEDDEAWDWTDHCGDLKWEYRQCKAEASCEELRDDPEIPGADNPCEEHFIAFIAAQCRYDRPRGG